MKILRARRIKPEDTHLHDWVVVASRGLTHGDGRRYDFPVVLEFVDTETGETTPVELFDGRDA